MSETMKINTEKKVNHIKGKSSLSKPYLISFYKENIFNNKCIDKDIENNISIKFNCKEKLPVKTINNRSFVLRPKYKKENYSKNNIILSQKSIYKNESSFIHDHKKCSRSKKIKIGNPKNNSRQFHARIKSLQVDFLNKNFHNNYNKEEKKIYEDKSKTIKQNKIKNNKINNLKDNFSKDYTINKNFYTCKLNNIFDDLEENSTKNTKILEQKILTFDNSSTDEKIIILSERNKKIKKYIKKEKENKKEINNSFSNRRKYKKLNNLINKGKNILKTPFYEKKKNFSPSLRNKLNNSKNNIFIKREQKKEDISSVINKLSVKKRNISKREKIKKEEPNLEEIEKNKKINNIIQKIKEKIKNNQKDINNKNNNRNIKSKGILFLKESKTIPIYSGFNDFYYNIKNNQNNSYKNTNKSTNNNKNQMKKIKLYKKKSPLTLKENIFFETNKKKIEKNISSIIKLKNHKKKVTKHNNIYNNSSTKKVKINKNLNKKIDINESELESEKSCFCSKSQNDIFNDFISKTLNKEEQIKNNKIKNKNKTKEKNPKDFEDKKIEKIENLCQKGFSGPDIKKINQDNFFIYNNFMNNPNYIYAGVCDGHGTFGQNVSGYLVYNLPLTINDIFIKEKIVNLTEENTSKVISIIKNTFLEIDKKIKSDTRIDSLFSGSTCVSIVFTPSKLICANLGDSRCIIGKYDGKKWFSKNISNDHKPDLIIEQKRIVKSGGRVEPFKNEEGNYIGPKRVWLKDENAPGLAMSRSFGDVVAHSVGVISEPEITEYTFLHEDKFIILASDGIWEYISSDECVNLVKDFYIKKDIIGSLNFLYKEASKRWIIEEEVIDDITLIIIFF